MQNWVRILAYLPVVLTLVPVKTPFIRLLHPDCLHFVEHLRLT